MQQYGPYDFRPMSHSEMVHYRKLQALYDAMSAMDSAEQYKPHRILGLGHHGGVMSAFDLKHQRYLAMKLKLQIPHKEALKEKDYWSGINHRNIVKLLDFYSSETQDVPNMIYSDSCFTMHGYKRNIRQELYTTGALGHPEVFRRVMRWLDGLMSALAYLWTRKLSHLDIREQNVMISETDDEAVFCGLTANSFVHEFVKRGRPGDDLSPVVITAGMDGSLYDMLCMGIMCLKIFLIGTPIWYEMRDINLWYNRKIHPVLKKALQEEVFLVRFLSVFRADKSVNEDRGRQALDFVYALLGLEDSPKREFDVPMKVPKEPAGVSASGTPLNNLIGESIVTAGLSDSVVEEKTDTEPINSVDEEKNTTQLNKTATEEVELSSEKESGISTSDDTIITVNLVGENIVAAELSDLVEKKTDKELFNSADEENNTTQLNKTATEEVELSSEKEPAILTSSEDPVIPDDPAGSDGAGSDFEIVENINDFEIVVPGTETDVANLPSESEAVDSSQCSMS